MNSSVSRYVLIWMPNIAESVCRKVGENWATLSQFDDSDTQIRVLHYCITETYPVLIHWWIVDAISLLCWSTTCFIILLSFTQNFYIAELYPILIHCWGIPYLNTLLSNFQILIHCWAIPRPNTLLRYNPSQNVAEQFPISIHTELYPIPTHCWDIPYLKT